MQPNWAEENLQVIRTLMERSALYRRALAPVMLSAGVLGLVGWFIGETLLRYSLREFIGLWFTIAAAAIAVSLLIVRRQALSSDEEFWTPATKRVTQAMLPPLIVGFLIPAGQLVAGRVGLAYCTYPVVLWPMLYGYALHSAGHYTSRGVRMLGWGFIIASLGITYLDLYSPSGIDSGPGLSWFTCHSAMGCMFGGFHLVAAAYLYFTEKRNPTP